MMGLIVLLLQGLLVVWAASTALVVHRLRNPPRRTYASALARGQPGDPSEADPPRPFHTFTFAARDGARSVELPAWRITGDDPSGPLIVCTPGWGDSRQGVLARLPGLAPHASVLVAWDPRGLGAAPGPCRLGTRADADDLCALVRALDPAGPVVLMGWSMGAGLSIVCAQRLLREGVVVAAVIAEAPYRLARTPVENYLRLIGLPRALTVPPAMAWLGWRLSEGPRWTGFDRAAHAAALPRPLLVLHGGADEVCPHEDGRAIAAAAQRAILITVENAGHNNLWTREPFRTQCVRAVADFLAAAMAGTRPAPAPAG